MIVEKATNEMLNQIKEIYLIAQKHMIDEGNVTQWNKDAEDFINQIKKYISKEEFYVVIKQNEIIGFFAMIYGKDKTYKNIIDGSWLNEDDYITIHKIAVKYYRQGIASFIFDYIETNCVKNNIFNIRIDTHKNNISMQKLLLKHNFIRCGIISITNNFKETTSLREAYIKHIK